MRSRHFLFLQGPTSPFFSRLGDKLVAEGARVSRINFNTGDAVYWRKKPSHSFKQTAQHLPQYLEHLVTQENVSDIIMVGDTRPVNAPAVPLAKRLGIRLHVFEEGYLRPNFLTLEEGGINGHSKLPKDPDWYRAAASVLAPNFTNLTVRNPVALLGLHEIGYHLPGLLNPILYPGYKTHRPYISGIELAGWAFRFAKMPYFERRDAENINSLIESGTPYYILPLQLDSDSQIQVHSDFETVSEVIETTLRSFARHAPHNSHIVIKNHPLDTGFVNYRKLITHLERELGIEGRTLYLESGNLPILLDHCKGVLVVNSTVGTSALIHKCPTFAFSSPIYDMPGLTAQCSLDAFWQHDVRPDQSLLEAFRRVVIHTTQINGGFYTQSGIEIGTDAAMSRLRLKECPLQSLLRRCPLPETQPETPVPAA